jgi:hypothetical protein
MPLSAFGGYSGNTSGGTNGTTVSVPSNGSSTNDSWIDYARLALGAYQALKKPSFSQQPMSPEQKQIYQIYLNNLMNPAYQKLGPDLVARMQQQTDKLGTGSWTSPKTFSGDVGYAGTGSPLSTAGGAFPLKPWGGGAAAQYPIRDASAITNREGGPGFNQDTSGQREPFMRQAPPEGGSEPQYGEDIGSWMARSPQDANPSNYEGVFPTRGGANDPNAPANQFADTNPAARTAYSPGDLPGFIQFMRSQGVKDAAKLGIGWFTGGLVGAAFATAKIAWDHFQSSRSTTAPPPTHGAGWGG